MASRKTRSIAFHSEELEVRTVPSADIGYTIATAHALGPMDQARTVIEGRLDVGVDSGWDIDMYSFEVTKGQTLAFDSAFGTAGKMWLRLFSADGTFLNPPVIDGNLFDGKKFTFSQAGTYYLGASCGGNYAYNPLDGSNRVSDNVWPSYTITLTNASPAPKPDLAVTKLAFGADLQRIDFTYTAKPAAFNKAFEAAIYYSADAKFDASDSLIDSRVLTAPGNVAPQSDAFNLTAPVVYDPAKPYLLVVLDPANGIDESNERNNVKSIKVPKSDIAMLDAKFVGDLQHLSFTYVDSFSGNFTVGFYRSAKPTFDGSAVEIAGTRRSVHGPSAGTLTVDFGAPLIPDEAKPYILVVADPDNVVEEKSERNNTADVVLPLVNVLFRGAKTINGMYTFALMSDSTLQFGTKSLSLLVRSARDISAYHVDQKAAGGAWHTVVSYDGTGLQPVKIKQRLAGDVQYRATITVDGIDYTTPVGKETHVDVLFPTYSEILKSENFLGGDGKHLSFGELSLAKWLGQGLDAKSGSPRQVSGAWIQLDTSTGMFSLMNPQSVALANNVPDVFLNLGARPADHFSGDGLSCTYVVASWRLHSVWEFVDESLGSRAVGPTAEEIAKAGLLNDDCPALVTDFKGSKGLITPGWKYLDPAQTTAAAVTNPLTGKPVVRREI